MSELTIEMWDAITTFDFYFENGHIISFYYAIYFLSYLRLNVYLELCRNKVLAFKALIIIVPLCLSCQLVFWLERNLESWTLRFPLLRSNSSTCPGVSHHSQCLITRLASQWSRLLSLLFLQVFDFTVIYNINHFQYLVH